MRYNQTQHCPQRFTTPVPYSKTQEKYPCEQKKRYHLSLLPPADDDTHITLICPDTYTYPSLEEGRPFGTVGIRFDRILHQNKRNKSFQLSPSEVPSPKQKHGQ